jgi:hypothetical protein
MIQSALPAAYEQSSMQSKQSEKKILSLNEKEKQGDERNLLLSWNDFESLESQQLQ